MALPNKSVPRLLISVYLIYSEMSTHKAMVLISIYLKYEKDLSQVNRQLYEWLEIVNDRSNRNTSTNRSKPKSVKRASLPIIAQNSENATVSAKNNSDYGKSDALPIANSNGRKLSLQQVLLLYFQ